MRACALLLLLLLAGPALADPRCAPPPDFLAAARPMPVTAHALEAGALRVLVLGSASVTGPGGSGPDASWPARLQH